ncbi:MAG TPA: hypothetical protein VFJ58_02570 [Armatimonadota bacterium]|nr:hypothetical protein [Armatimonadota bacterium]
MVPEEDLDTLDGKSGCNCLVMETAQQVATMLRERGNNEGRG